MNRNGRDKIGEEGKRAQLRSEGRAPKDPAAQALGSKGGKKRAERLTAQRRSEIARLAASARWSQKQASSSEQKSDYER